MYEMRHPILVVLFLIYTHYPQCICMKWAQVATIVELDSPSAQASVHITATTE